MAGVTIGSAIMAVVLTSVMGITRGTIAMLHYGDMNRDSRATLETLAQDCRLGTDVETALPHELKLQTQGPDGPVTIRYRYQPNSKTLYRSEDAGSLEVVLTDIEDLEFQYFNILQNPTNKAIEVKRIQIEVLMRKNIQKQEATDHIISASFMMRNRRVST